MNWRWRARLRVWRLPATLAAANLPVKLAGASVQPACQPVNQPASQFPSTILSASATSLYPLSFQPVQPVSQPVSPVSPSIPSVVLSASATSLSVILVGYPFSQYNWPVRQAVSPSVPCAVLYGSRVCPSAESQDPQPQPISPSLPQR